MKKDLTIIPSSVIIGSWDRVKFPKFTEYLLSQEYVNFRLRFFEESQ